MKRIILNTMTILLFAYVLSAATEWKINFEKATVKFTMPTEEVNGTLSGLKASFIFDENDLANSKITASVDAATLSTGDKKRDDHLHTSDFFDVEKFPQISFISTEIKKTEKGFVAVGNLKMKEKEKSVEILFTLETKESEMIFKANFAIYPSDFGVTSRPKDEKEKEGEKVLVEIEVPVSK